MARLKIRPLDDWIVVEQDEAEERTPGGIVLPEQAKEKPTRGTVLAAGPGKLMKSGHRGPLGVKAGDEVFYRKYAGTEVEIETKKYTIVRENDVLAVIER
jgi:chaperonin GroES